MYGFDINNGYKLVSATFNDTGTAYVDQLFSRKPYVFEEVCYSGTNGTTRTLNHNLQSVPEMMIYKARTGTDSGFKVYHLALGNTKSLALSRDSTPDTSVSFWGNTDPTGTQFTVGSAGNAASTTYVAYLFATLPGISKVGSYTGNGSSQTINCGFTAGARFFMAKRSDSAGDWLVWDTTRGMVAGNDPHLSLNTTAAEVTTDDSVDTDASGVVVNQDAATNINVNAATYIFLAVA
jgi:hypothetical protein